MKKMCQFYSDSSRFFLQPTVRLTLNFFLQEALEFVLETPLHRITNCVTKHQT
jgi:hypothetical protein